MNAQILEQIKGMYSRLKALRDGYEGVAYQQTCENYNFIFEKLMLILDENLKEEIRDLKLNNQIYSYDEYYRERRVEGEVFKTYLYQLTFWLEDKFLFNDKIKIIGNLIEQIKDKEIKARCIDLLAAPEYFDRAISQATQIFEDRLKEKSRKRDLTSTQLVNATIKPDPQNTIIKFSDKNDLQEGFSFICKGIMLYLRNPSHHSLNGETSREDAIKVCAFIDFVLQDLEKCQSKIVS